VHRLEAAFCRTNLHRRPGTHRLRNALEFLRPNALKLEQIAEQFSRAQTDLTDAEWRVLFVSSASTCWLPDGEIAMERVFIGTTRADATRMADEWWSRQKGQRQTLRTEVAIGGKGPDDQLRRWAATHRRRSGDFWSMADRVATGRLLDPVQLERSQTAVPPPRVMVNR
jgi:hypothetical protein